MPLFNFLSFNTGNCPQLTWWIKKETASLWFPSANTWLHFYSIAAINLLFILCFFPPCLVCLSKYVHCTVSQTIYWQLVCCFLFENHITEQVNGLWFFFVSKSAFFSSALRLSCVYLHIYEYLLLVYIHLRHGRWCTCMKNKTKQQTVIQ